MKNLIIILTSLMLLGCSKNYLFTRDNIAISEELKKMNKEDQDVRWLSGPIDKKYNLRTYDTVMDSIIEINSSLENVDFNFKPISEQIKKLSQQDREKYLAEVDERSKKMHYIDSINFEKTYKIIKKYGFPDYDLRDWKHDSLRQGIVTMTTHFDYSSKKGKKMQKLIIKEYKKGRVDDVGMRQMLWHMKGRKGGAIGDLEGKSIDEVILEMEKSIE